MMKEKIEPTKCFKCKIKISPKENFFRLQVFNRGVFHMQTYYHINCFKESIHGTKEQKEIIKKGNKFINKAFKKLEEIQQIKEVDY